ncbi:hypothetical protein EVAR_84243_1 [Eumeta japonica]|uniref:Uncharacterized protein n=1 Tax=Eumeta variegata TaxID=151549 RepID=A0A4C1WSE9_EUMVA|nr:hypothetical protein EVAR_84243_1 [Eumeta japonica]
MTVRAEDIKKKNHADSKFIDVRRRFGVGLEGPGGIMNLRAPQEPSIKANRRKALKNFEEAKIGSRIESRDRSRNRAWDRHQALERRVTPSYNSEIKRDIDRATSPPPSHSASSSRVYYARHLVIFFWKNLQW